MEHHTKKTKNRKIVPLRGLFVIKKGGKIMTTDNPKLYEAFEEEAKDINIEELMQEMLGNFQAEKGYTPTPADEIRIRKMMLARKYIEKEADRLTMLRNAIMEDWNAKITRKFQEIDNINEFIEKWLKEANAGEKLSLDVGTATLRRSAPKTKVVDKDKAKDFLVASGQLNSFLKAPELDTTLLQNAYVNQFNQLVEAEANARISQEITESAKGKITKKREGEIKLEVERELADNYFSQLPDFLEYVPEQQKLSITMK